MRVKVWVEAEADADISLEDVFAELGGLPASERQSEVLSAINAAHGILKRISLECIGEMNDKQRELIGTALREQAARYLPPNAALANPDGR